MKTVEMKKTIQAAAKESNVIIKNYQKIRIISHTITLGNPWIYNHNYIFEYNGCLYEQTSKVTGYFSAVCKHETRKIV